MKNKDIIDFVFPYVDCTDSKWQMIYRQYCDDHGINKPLEKERFRSWDLLRYYFRGIDKYMPFIRNVYMIVSNTEQVPKWLDRSKVKIILHKDIIPKEYLPTFSSPCIEMFLGQIEGLSEKFIYGNDDIFTIGPTMPDDFFTADDKVKVRLNQRNLNNNHSNFEQTVYKEYKMIAKYYGKSDDTFNYEKPSHGFFPMLKSQVLSAQHKFKAEIERSINAFRTCEDINQYLYTYEAKFNNKLVHGGPTFVYIGNERSLAKAVNSIENHKYQTICINDAVWPNFDHDKYEIKKAFSKIFPATCRFELDNNSKNIEKNRKLADELYLYF